MSSLTLPPRLRAPEFFAPLSLLAVALLAFNDHVLKRHAPGWLSGKLSDVALCFFLPLFLSALASIIVPGRGRLRLHVGCLVTAVVYTVLEMSSEAASWFCRVLPAVSGPLGAGWSCTLTRDVTDLACLVFVPLAYLYGSARLRRESRGQ